MLNMVLTSGSVAILSYLIGSITGAYYVVRYFLKEDIRQLGSGNVGATNAGRALGKKGFLWTLAIDIAKVFVALSLTYLLTDGNIFYLTLASFFLLLGHLYPIQLCFHGGKGVVVFLASALVLSPITIGVMAIVFAVTYLIFRRYTLAGFISMATIPVTSFVIDDSPITSIGLLLLFAIVVVSHRN